MLNNDTATYRLRIDAKRGKLVSKIKNPNDEWVEGKAIGAIAGVLEDAIIKWPETSEKPYIHLMFSAGGETLKVYGPLNNTVLDLINRLSGEAEPFGQECTLKIWPVPLVDGKSTAGISLYANGERCEWKFPPQQMAGIRKAGHDKHVEMFEKFVKPKVEAYKASNFDPMDPLQTGHPQPTPAQANGYDDPADRFNEDDLPF